MVKFLLNNTLLKTIVLNDKVEVRLLALFGVFSILLEFGTVGGLFYLMEIFKALDASYREEVVVTFLGLKQSQLFLLSTITFISSRYPCQFPVL